MKKNKTIYVSIVGMGQMGGSLGKALRLKTFSKGSPRSKYHITGIGRNKHKLKAALKAGAADAISDDLNSAAGSDIIVICLPVDLIIPTYEKLLKIADKQTIITDAGSVKGAFARLALRKGNGKSSVPEFVGAHPMAGREKNGIDSALAEMFQNANVVITESSSSRAEKIVADMWKDAGAKIVKMSSVKHDNLVALTSHLPHIIAFSLNKIYKRTKRKKQDIDKLTAGSFKSMTRVSVSSADMWAPIFKMNSENIDIYLKSFIKELKTFEKILNNRDKLKKEISETQK